MAPGPGSSNARVKCMVVPRPTSLWTASCPPIFCTSREEIVSPSPVPPNRRRKERSACSKASKIRDCFSSGMPMPVSLTANCSTASCSVCDSHSTFEDDFALFGELDGVADEIDDDLVQPRRDRPPRPAERRADVAGQLEALAVGPHGQRLQRVAQRLVQIERDMLQLQLAGFDLGEVQDVVDDRQQGLARLLQDSRCSRCSPDSGVSSSNSVMPMMAFIGVRISWLMLARNWLLAWLAASAACLARFNSSSTRCALLDFPFQQRAVMQDLREGRHRLLHQRLVRQLAVLDSQPGERRDGLGAAPEDVELPGGRGSPDIGLHRDVVVRLDPEPPRRSRECLARQVLSRLPRCQRNPPLPPPASRGRSGSRPAPSAPSRPASGRTDS